MSSLINVRKWAALMVVMLLAAVGVMVVQQPSSAADAPGSILQVYKFKKDTYAPLVGMTFAGESCTRSSGAPTWQCESLPSAVTEMSDRWASEEIDKFITMSAPVGSSCTVSASDSSASMQKVRLWEVTAPQGYQVISGEFTVCYTATGWTEMSNTAGTDVVFYADQTGGFVQFFDTPIGTSTPPTILYPSVSLTGACGTSNDTVLPSSSSDYTSGTPVWSGTQVSVAFTMNQGVTNKTFANGQRTTTVTAAESDTSACPTEQPSTPPAPTPVPSPILVPPPVVTPPSVPAPIVVAAPKTKVVQKCGANNDRVRVAKSSLFTSTKSKWRKNRLKVTYTASAGHVFSSGSTKVLKIVRDKNRACV